MPAAPGPHQWPTRRSSAPAAALVILFALGAALLYSADGAAATASHFLYVPVIVAASIYGPAGGIAAGVVCALLAGPALSAALAGAVTAAAALSWGSAGTGYVTVGAVTGMAFRIMGRQTQELTRLRFTDAATELPNISAARAYLRGTNMLGLPAGPGTYTVLSIRILNHEKLVETFGQGHVRQLVQRFAGLLRDRLGDETFVARSAPDRLALIHPRGQDDAERLLPVIDGIASHPVDVSGVPLFLDIATGLACSESPDDDPEEMIARADVATTRAAGAGRDTAVYDGRRESDHRRGLKLLGEVDRALAEGQFHLVYQPKLDLATGRLLGAEALARWHHPEHGPLSPGAFIPLLEQTRLVDPFARWSVQTAIDQALAWRHAGLWVPVAVNVAARNLHSDTLLDFVDRTLDGRGIDAALLELEITETALLNIGAPRLRQLERLRDRGVGISVDDFGTGYASLTYIRDLPVTAVKLDRSFIHALPERPRDRALVYRVIQMAHDLGQRVIGEGVEDAATLQSLQALGCDAAQGFHIARPAAPADARRLLAAPAWSPPAGSGAA